MTIIDSQVHAYEANTPKRPWHNVPNWPDHVTGDEMVAAMDKLGIDGAIFISAFAMYRFDGSYAVEVQRAYPGRFAIVKPVDPDDAAVADVIADWKKTPGTVGIRIMLMKEANREPNDPGLDRILRAGGRPGAFIAESVLSCAGQIVLPPGYLDAAYGHVRAAGGVCIADEVQTGFGRVGSRFWAFETQGVVPDIVTMGKPMGNGHPLGAVVTTRAIADAFAGGMEYFNTFGGNPVSCAIGLAVLDVIEGDGLQAHAREVGTRFINRLRELGTRHDLVGNVRGEGLFIGVELVRDRATLEPAAAEADAVVEAMRHRGILLSTDGPHHNVIKVKPPLVFTRENADEVVAALDEVLAAL